MDTSSQEDLARLDAEVALCLKLFGTWANRRRNALRLSQQETARRGGFSRTEMSHLEAGHTNLTMSTFIRVCRSLKRGIGETASHLEHLLDHPEDRPAEGPRRSQRGKNTRRAAH